MFSKWVFDQFADSEHGKPRPHGCHDDGHQRQRILSAKELAVKANHAAVHVIEHVRGGQVTGCEWAIGV